eukprot:evm.model.scf_1524.4 EVM.evm.TU.scf_1524.4   scf_1524:26654-27979(-)
MRHACLFLVEGWERHGCKTMPDKCKCSASSEVSLLIPLQLSSVEKLGMSPLLLPSCAQIHVDYRRSGWGDLPEHLLGQVLGILCTQEDIAHRDSSLAMMQFVNKHWCRWANETAASVVPSVQVPTPITLRELRAHVALNFTNIHALQVESRDCISRRQLAVLQALPALKHLSMSHCSRLTDDSLGAIANLTNLVGLDLQSCGRIGELMGQLGRLTHLTQLNLRWCHRLNNQSVSFLVGLKNLTCLSLGQCSRISNAGLRCLGPLTKLIHLELDNCPGITDVGLKHIAHLKHLTYLNLSCCPGITDDGLRHVAHLTKITHLNLARCERIGDAGLAHLACLTNLTHLDLGLCSQVGSGNLVSLHPLVGLTHLSLRWCYKVSDMCLWSLTILENLEHLDLRGCSKISNKGARALALFGRLSHLDLRQCSLIGDAVLRELGDGMK